MNTAPLMGPFFTKFVQKHRFCRTIGMQDPLPAAARGVAAVRPVQGGLLLHRGELGAGVAPGAEESRRLGRGGGGLCSGGGGGRVLLLLRVHHNVLLHNNRRPLVLRHFLPPAVTPAARVLLPL